MLPAGSVSRLFEHLLGEDFARLPPPVQALHKAALPARFMGQVHVEPATGRAARLLARLLGLPVVEAEAPVIVEIQATPVGQRWIRFFPPRPMRSRLWSENDLLREQLGPVLLTFKLHGDADGIRWEIVEARALGLSAPRAWLRDVRAVESAEGGRYRFEVSAALPWFGHLVAYRGWLEVEPRNEK